MSDLKKRIKHGMKTETQLENRNRDLIRKELSISKHSSKTPSAEEQSFKY